MFCLAEWIETTTYHPESRPLPIRIDGRKVPSPQLDCKVNQRLIPFLDIPIRSLGKDEQAETVQVRGIERPCVPFWVALSITQKGALDHGNPPVFLGGIFRGDMNLANPVFFQMSHFFEGPKVYPNKASVSQ